MVLIVKSKLCIYNNEDGTRRVVLKDRNNFIVTTYERVSTSVNDEIPYLWCRGHYLELRTNQTHKVLSCEFDSLPTPDLYLNNNVIEGNWNYSNEPMPIRFGE